MTLLAILVAIIIVLAAIVFIAQFEQWTNRRDDTVTRLAFEEQKYAQCLRDAANHADDNAVDVAASDVAHMKIILVRCYESKPWFLSGEERKRIKQCNDEVAAFNGRGQKTKHEPFLIQDFPASLPARPSLASPPYPYELREKRLFGNGYAKAWFDESGHCFNVVMAVSTGSGMLDTNTITFGLANWTGKPKTSIDVPITYKLR